MKKVISDDELRAELVKTIEGLLFMSESDYPFEVVSWGTDKEDLTLERMRQLAGSDASTPVEETTIEQFFRVAAGEQEWKGAAELALAKRYQALIYLLEKNLTHLKVYRVGVVNISVYIIGRSHTNSLIGISTRVVET